MQDGWNYKKKGVFNMKKGKILSVLGTVLCAVAVVFAQAPCMGLLYETKVPKCLEK